MNEPSETPPPKRRRREHLLRFACGLAVFALVLIVWSIVRPTPLPVLVALSVGQALGTASFAVYLFIVAADLGLRKKLKGDRPAPTVPPAPAEKPE